MIRRRLGNVGNSHFQLDIGLDGCQFIGKTNHRLLLAEFLGKAFAATKRQRGHPIQVIRHLIDTANPLQQRHRGFRTDARHTRDVVAGIAHQRQIVDNELGRHAKTIDHPLPIRGLTFHGIDQRHMGRHQLRHIFITGTDQDLDLLLGGLTCQRPDDVIRFHTINHQQRQAHSADNGMDRRDLGS